MSTYHIRPRFSVGKILRNEHLAALEQQSFDFPALLFDGWSNGILSGCKLSSTQNIVTMGTGVVCFERKLYHIQEPICIEYYPTDETRYLKLYIGSNEGNGTCDMRRFTLKLSERESLGSGEFELCRFRLQHGAYLRCNYTNFQDRETLYDTLNTIHSTYSAQDGAGINPNITKAYAKEALQIGKIPDFDAAVCVNWLQQPYAVSETVISYYLKQVNCTSTIQMEKQAIFQALRTRLEQLRTGNNGQLKETVSERKRILID